MFNVLIHIIMELQKLPKKYRHMNINDYKSNTSKYLINFKNTNTLDKIKQFDKFLVDNHKLLAEELLIIIVFLRDNLEKNNVKSPIVVKISYNHNIIQRDFDINKKIKDIEGFIKYDYIFEYYDNNHLYKFLIMPYTESKSLGEHFWKDDDKLKLRSLYKQIIMAYLIAFNKYKFIHVDNHLDNFLIKRTNKEKIIYELDNISINTHGVQIIIMDFDKSLDEQYNKSFLSTYNERNFIIEFFRNIKNLFNKEFKYINILSGTIISYIESIQNSTNVNDILHLLDLIDNLDYHMRQ